MINILIIDDDKTKVRNITALLDTIPGCTYDIAPDLVSARGFLQKNYSLVIVDMNLPQRFGEDPKESAGMDFILEIKKTRRLRLPEHIVGLTEIATLHDKYKGLLEENLITLIKYDGSEIDWGKKIKIKVEEIIEHKISANNDANFIFDVAFVSALLSPELEAVLQLNYNWQKHKIPNDSSNYWLGKIILSDERTLNVVATHLPQMGMVATATACSKVITRFRPKYLLMTGICGGVKGKVNLGDIVISDLSFDLDSGKITEQDDKPVFEPDFRSIPLDPTLKESLMMLTAEKDTLRGIKDKWQGEAQSAELKLHIGPVGSGAAVISNAQYVEEKIQHQRKLIAIDMETYAVFYSSQYCKDPKPKALSIKSISDYADAHKNDTIQKYGSFISAITADHVIRTILFQH